MRILVITDDKYLYRKAELELASHEILSTDTAAHPDLIIYDKDSLLPCPEAERIITLSRSTDADYTIPLPLDALTEIIAERKVTSRLTLKKEASAAILDGKLIKLTAHEYSLLSLLISGGKEFTPREKIEKEIFPELSCGMINVYIHYLREKLETSNEKIVLSSRKYGYKINEKFIEGVVEC